jgi:hypothetical protein
MKNVIFILLFLFGLQTKSQNINWCDSIQVLGGWSNGIDSDPIHIEISGFLNTYVLWQISSYGNNWYDIEYTGNNVVFWNYNPSTNLPYDTITICITYVGSKNAQNNCCNSFYSIPHGNWDLNWIKIQNITFIKEVTNKITNNKIYDLYGREIAEPKGLYIKNNKLYYVR